MVVMINSTTPIITDYKVFPVAGYDSMLLTLSGAHSPFFTRNIVIMKDSSGNTGIGEVHGGEHNRKALESYRPFLIGRHIGEWKGIVKSIKRNNYAPGEALGSGGSNIIQGFDLKNFVRDVVHTETAVECALLDLVGKFMGVPLAALLGDGIQREKVPFLGYLFYVADGSKTDLPYLHENESKDSWYRMRRQPALTTDAIVEQAQAAHAKYGFRDFKLKGGVFRGEDEMNTVKALKRAFPEGRINIDPNGAWSLDEAIGLCKDMHGVMTYVEDPCGPEKGFSGREIMAEFKRATGFQVATNMIATDWRQLRHSLVLGSIDIPLADPHFWTMEGSVMVAQLCSEWGLTWGSHSNNHFDISLAVFAHVAAAAPGEINAVDTHFIWQDGQYLCKDPMPIEDGQVALRLDRPGLGVEIDMDAVEKATALYAKLPSGDRDDAVAMQYLIPGWKFNSKKPCMVR